MFVNDTFLKVSSITCINNSRASHVLFGCSLGSVVIVGKYETKSAFSFNDKKYKSTYLYMNDGHHFHIKEIVLLTAVA